MSWGKFGDGDVRGGFIGFKRLVGGVLALVTSRKLGEVSVVVTLPEERKQRKLRLK